jgi:two-component system sensor histidine kinase YesM
MIDENARQLLEEEAALYKRSIIYRVLEDDPRGIFLARTVHVINNYTFSYPGTLVLRVNMQRILSDLSKGSTQSDPAVILLSSEDGVLYRAGPLPEGAQDAILSMQGQQSVAKLSGEVYLIQQRTSAKLGLRYFYLIHFRNYQAIRSTYGIMIGLNVLLALLLLHISKRILDSITVHFETLNKKMRVYSSGQLTPIDVGYDYTKRNDELGMPICSWTAWPSKSER